MNSEYCDDKDGAPSPYDEEIKTGAQRKEKKRTAAQEEEKKKTRQSEHHITQPSVLRAGFHPRSGAPPKLVLGLARQVELGFGCTDFLRWLLP